MNDTVSPVEIARSVSMRLRSLVRGLPHAGEERSFRLLPGRLETRRFLVGVAPEGWPYLPLATLAEKLDMPRRLQKDFLADLDRADMLGLGFDEDESGCLLSTLVEFPVAIGRPEFGDENGPAGVMGRAYRWLPGLGGEGWHSEFLCFPEMDIGAIRQRTAGMLKDSPPALAAMFALMDQALDNSDLPDWEYLEEYRDDRASAGFDLDISAARLRLEDIQETLTTLCSAWRIPAEHLASALETTAGQPLHRLSAGRDSKSRPFLTLHYEA